MIKEIKKLIEQEKKKGGSFAAVSVIESIRSYANDRQSCW